MTAAAQRRRGRWRRANSRRKLERAANSERDTSAIDDSFDIDQPDRLLLSALKYWEVERDLIEERLDTMRSATAAS